MKTLILNECDLIYCISGQLYSQAPNRSPRNAEKIISKVVELFRKNAENFNEFYYISIELNKKILSKYIRSLLMEIEEFKNLNLSQIEFENNVLVDDPARAKFSFSSMYDKNGSDSWKNDFIDLDAFINNVCISLIEKYKENDKMELIQDLAKIEFLKIIEMHKYVDNHHFYAIIKEEIEEAEENFELIKNLFENQIDSIWNYVKQNKDISTNVEVLKKACIKAVLELIQIIACTDKYLLQSKIKL